MLNPRALPSQSPTATNAAVGSAGTSYLIEIILPAVQLNLS
jgi:hypothetical protein